MTPLAVMEAIATVLWVYAIVAGVEWLWRVARMDRRHHIPQVVELLANLVPVMIALVAVVLAGAMIGLPSVVVIIAVLFPAGLAFGLHQSLNELRDAVWRVEGLKLVLILLIAAFVIWRRQFAG